MTLSDLSSAIAPIICAIGGVVLMLVDLAIPKPRKSATAWIAAAVLLLALLAVPTQWGASTPGFAGMVVNDGYALFLDALLAIIGIVTVVLTIRYNEARGIMRGEFYPLTLFAMSGMMLMGHAANLIMVFVAIELLSIPLYVLCGFARPKVESEESALKYFLLGAFASGFLVYGIALVYGATGTIELTKLSALLQPGGPVVISVNTTLLLAGAALVLVGLAFKVATVPFHMWTPDVYQGAPTTVTAFMATATKTAGFAALLRVFVFGLGPIIESWIVPISVLAGLSMVFGNIAALAQNNLKRMLAYSSIAHAGYTMVGVAASVGNDQGVSAVLFYLAAYALTSLAAFAVMIALSSGESEDHSLDAYAGLGKRKPLLALVLTISMLSLLGIPPTAGFFGKYFLLTAAIQENQILLALLLVLSSVISAVFYLRVIMTMYMRASVNDAPIPANWPRSAAAFVTSAATVLFGVLASPLIELINSGIKTVAR